MSNEAGTEAAAATVAIAKTNCLSRDFICDRPFAFTIINKKITKTKKKLFRRPDAVLPDAAVFPVFSGKVSNPTV